MPVTVTPRSAYIDGEGALQGSLILTGDLAVTRPNVGSILEESYAILLPLTLWRMQFGRVTRSPFPGYDRVTVAIRQTGGSLWNPVRREFVTALTINIANEVYSCQRIGFRRGSTDALFRPGEAHPYMPKCGTEAENLGVARARLGDFILFLDGSNSPTMHSYFVNYPEEMRPPTSGQYELVMSFQWYLQIGSRTDMYDAKERIRITEEHVVPFQIA